MNLDGEWSNQSSVLLLGFARHLKQYYKLLKLLPPKLHDWKQFPVQTIHARRRHHPLFILLFELSKSSSKLLLFFFFWHYQKPLRNLSTYFLRFYNLFVEGGVFRTLMYVLEPSYINQIRIIFERRAIVIGSLVTDTNVCPTELSSPLLCGFLSLIPNLSRDRII